VGAIAGALEVHHAVEAGVGGGVALVAVSIELLLGEDVAAVLRAQDGGQRGSQSRARGMGVWCKHKHTSQENDTMVEGQTGGEELAGRQWKREKKRMRGRAAQHGSSGHGVAEGEGEGGDGGIHSFRFRFRRWH